MLMRPSYILSIWKHKLLKRGVYIPYHCFISSHSLLNLFLSLFCFQDSAKTIPVTVTGDITSPKSSSQLSPLILLHLLVALSQLSLSAPCNISLLTSRTSCTLFDFSSFFTSHCFLSPLLISLLLSEVLTLEYLKLWSLGAHSFLRSLMISCNLYICTLMPPKW